MTHDVAIVGAGPAGSSLAILLARSGYDVVLLEQSRFPRDKVCGDMVSPRAFHLLTALGCGEGLETLRAKPIRTAEVILDGEILSATDLPDVEELPGICRAIPRLQLDDVVFRVACASGAVAVEDCRVRGFQSEDEFVAIRTEVEGEPREIRARFLVGADGAQSIVARSAGLAVKDPCHTVSAMRGYATGLSLDRASFFFSTDLFPGYAWIFPMRDGELNYGAGLIAEASSRERLRVREFLTEVQDMIAQRARAVGAEVRIDAPVGWPIRTFRPEDRRIFDRGLLIGEAGGFVDPINGEGISLAVETAALAAEAIDEALQIGAPTFESYERAWRDSFEADLRVGDLLVSLIRNRRLRDLWLTWFRQVNRRARSDESYAALVNGVLAGVIPNRELLRSDVVLKSLAQDGQFLSDYLDGAGHSGASVWARIPQLYLRELFRMTDSIRDGAWTAGWLFDVLSKQAGVLGSVRRSS